ncbi:hypothetical protein CLBKND_04749 [Methylorubrum aminovorans]
MDATDTIETLSAKPYAANRASDGRIELWDDEDRLATLPADFPVGMLAAVAQAIEAAYDRGHHRGAVDKAFEIRRALLL